jgi:hypothetical protein
VLFPAAAAQAAVAPSAIAAATPASASAAAPSSKKKPKKSSLKAGPAARFPGWEVVVGIEVHAQITARSKLFSAASTRFGSAPNSHASAVDAALPGTLPVLNAHDVAQAARTGLGLGGDVQLRSTFERKHYFYCDMPQGYQITQQQCQSSCSDVIFSQPAHDASGLILCCASLFLFVSLLLQFPLSAAVP